MTNSEQLQKVICSHVDVREEAIHIGHILCAYAKLHEAEELTEQFVHDVGRIVRLYNRKKLILEQEPRVIESLYQLLCIE